jgi:transcription elongation GreA/GreB family factor
MGDDGGLVVGVGSRVHITGPTIAEQVVMLVCGRERQSPAFLSARTALGQALLGRRAGDEVEVETDAGMVKVVVLSVRDRDGAIEP